MGRKLKRQATRRNNKRNSQPKYSLYAVQRAMNIALEMRKLTKGHLFNKALVDDKQNNLCTFCGKTMKTKKLCDFWFLTFLDRMQVVLINPDYFKDNEIEAMWLQNDDAYKDVRIPLNDPTKT